MASKPDSTSRIMRLIAGALLGASVGGMVYTQNYGLAAGFFVFDLFLITEGFK